MPKDRVETIDRIDGLEDLVRDYLTRKFPNDEFPGLGDRTHQEWHDLYLSSLDDITDFTLPVCIP